MCKHFQQFGIEKTIFHEDFKEDVTKLENDIALIRVNRPIEFGSKMKPVCLPFGDNRIMAPRTGTLLTFSGWGVMENSKTIAKLDAIFVLLDRKWCEKPVSETQLCVVAAGQANCYGDSGGPLMKLVNDRMILEGMVSYGNWDCQDHHSVYTRIRSYGHWLDENMQM